MSLFSFDKYIYPFTNASASILSKIGHSYQLIFRALAFLLALFLVVWQMPRTVKFKYEYQKMRPWQYESLYAPFNFPIYKTAEQLKVEEEASLKDFYPIFVFDANVSKNNKTAMLQDFDNQWYGNEVDKLRNRIVPFVNFGNTVGYIVIMISLATSLSKLFISSMLIGSIAAFSSKNTNLLSKVDTV
mgnify:CR=1 FL=1